MNLEAATLGFTHSLALFPFRATNLSHHENKLTADRILTLNVFWVGARQEEVDFSPAELPWTVIHNTALPSVSGVNRSEIALFVLAARYRIFY